MKKIISFLLVLLLICSYISVYAQPSQPDGLRSKNILLIDTNTDRTIYEKGASDKIQPGGISKILTAISVIEIVSSLDERATADVATLDSFDYSYNNVGILPGETLTIRDLLYSMLLNDAGDAANVLAVYACGSREVFISQLNKLASDIGCKDTNITNPDGSYEEGQYTTLVDGAKIIQYAMKYTDFREIVSTLSYEIPPTNKYRETRYLLNKNKFLSDLSTNKYYNEYVTGVKTSYISDDNCGLFITYENKNNKLLCLTMGAPYENGINYATEDCLKLIDYGINYYNPVKVASKSEIMAEVKVKGGKESGKVLLLAIDDLYVNLPKGYDESKLEKSITAESVKKAPVNKGDALGQITIMYDGEKYASVVLVADQSIRYSLVKHIIDAVTGFLTSWPFILCVVLVFGLFIAYTVLVNKAKRTRKYVSRFRDYR